MMRNLERDVRFLKAYAILITVAFGFFFMWAPESHGDKQHFAEIDVERINVVEADGQLRMVISNQERQHPGIVNGKVIPRDNPRPPGMIFFNHLGDEMGGLVFGENGGDGHFGSLTFDKVRNDQAIGFRYLESDNGTYSTGLEIWQQPDIPSDEMMAKYRAARDIEDSVARKAAIQAMIDNNELTARRLFLGKWRDNTTALVLSDLKGNPRMRLAVGAEGEARIDFLDESGAVTHSYPE